jgi:hypothetical protein
MAPKCARLLSGARPSANTDAIQPSQREGRMRAVARGVEEEHAMLHQQVRAGYAG